MARITCAWQFQPIERINLKVQLSLDQPITDDLIRRLVEFREQANMTESDGEQQIRLVHPRPVNFY